MACLFLKGKKSEVESVKQISDLNSQSVAKKVEGKKKKRCRSVHLCQNFRSHQYSAFEGNLLMVPIYNVWICIFK